MGYGDNYVPCDIGDAGYLGHSHTTHPGVLGPLNIRGRHICFVLAPQDPTGWLGAFCNRSLLFVNNVVVDQRQEQEGGI